MFTVIKEESEQRLKDLEILYNVCPDRFCLNKWNTSLKSVLQKEIADVKWRLNRAAVESWCNKKGVELGYFETNADYDYYMALENHKIDHEKALVELLKEQEQAIKALEVMKEEVKKKKNDIILEALLIEIGQLPE